MKRFNEFGIVSETKAFKGDRIDIEKVLNKEIKVIAFKIEPSKYPKPGCEECLYLQIEHKDELRVIFSASGYLINAIKKVSEDDFPFLTTIVKEEKRFEFT